MNKAIIFIFLSVITISSFAGETRLQHDGLVIIAKYESDSVEKSNGSNFLYGKVQITNNALTPKNYSNKHLFLNIDGNISRTYFDTIASVAIDFTSITLQSYETRKLDVYWSFNSPVSTEKKTATLQWTE